MRQEFIVAEKEFKDHITSKRFLAILAIFMLLAVYAMITGMDSYNKSLDAYKQQQASKDPWRQETINNYQKQIQDAESRGAPAEEIESLKNSLDNFINPPMPSVLIVFTSFTLLFAVMGMILSVSMGFDQISKEKEDGSLKTVLSSPMYRDALINGKSLGAIGTLAVTMAATFLVTIAIMLLYGVVPNADDMIRIVIFFIAALMYCTVFFAIAMAMSTIAKSSTMAVIYTIGIVFLVLLFSILSYFMADMIAGSIVGPSPEYPYTPYTQSYSTYTDANGTVVYTKSDAITYINTTSDNTSQPMPLPAPSISPEYTAYNDYWMKKSRITSQIADTIGTISPINDFTGALGSGGSGIAGAILSKQKPYDFSSSYWMPSNKTISVWESLSYVWMKILALIVEIVVAFAVSYVMFMRMDVR